MTARNEQTNVSSWPIGMPDPTHPFASQQCRNAVDFYALTNGCFVLQDSQIWTEDQAYRICDTPQQREMMQASHGFTRILGPKGCVISEPADDEEGICHTDIDLADIIPVKHLIDTAGHYSTPGITRLHVDMSEHGPVHLDGGLQRRELRYDDMVDASE